MNHHFNVFTHFSDMLVTCHLKNVNMFHMTFGFEHCKRNNSTMNFSRSGSGLTGISQITSGIGLDLLISPPSQLTFFGGEHGEFAVICLGCLIFFENRNYLQIPYLTNHCWQTLAVSAYMNRI